jgi:stage III sporulation protein AE
MKKCLILIFFILILAIPTHAEEITAPPAPDSAQDLMPYEQESFLDGVLHVLKSGLNAAAPACYEALGLCGKVLVLVLCLRLARCLGTGANHVLTLCAALSIGWFLLQSTDIFVRSAADTVAELSAYGKLLLPVMTTALAAQGGSSSAMALYGGTAFFDVLLSTAIEKLLIPLVYIFLALSLLAAATENEALAKMKKSLYQITTKGLRIALYLFTGYLTVTGVIGGSADQMQLKAAKLTISGMVPVVGNIMADASETILVSAGLVKSAVGIYGLLAIVATAMVPSLTVAIRYGFLKATAAAASLLGGKEESALIGDFGSAMGLLLAMTLTQSLLFLISTVCFMKGMG